MQNNSQIEFLTMSLQNRFKANFSHIYKYALKYRPQ